MGCLGYFIVFAIIMALVQFLMELFNKIAPLLLGILLLFCTFVLIKVLKPIFLKIKIRIFENRYYYSEDFLNLKQRVEKYIVNCNNLNNHILELRNVKLGVNQLNNGNSTYYDASNYNYSRPEYDKFVQSENVYNCSRTICDNARMHPFKYICKYFNIEQTEETLERFENLLNNFEAAKDGQVLLKKEKNRILESIENETPIIIKKYGMDRFQNELGFKLVEFGELEFPSYTFQYVSPGGNASSKCDVVMDIDNLNNFIKYLSEIIKFKNSIKGQRALMTSSLRRKILDRDNFTCQLCGNSNKDEPNLLLEIDHIIPLAKGGMTTEDNLQVLCWKCNRSKGAKILGNMKAKSVVFEEEKQEISKIECGNVRNSEENVIKISKNTLDAFQEHNNIGVFDFTIKGDKVEITKEEVTKKKLKAQKEKASMYDRERGIYPSGRYLIGRDLPLGGYLFKSKDGKNGSVTLYRSYNDCINEEGEIFWDSFSDDYFISLVEEGQYICVENADIKKV